MGSSRSSRSRPRPRAKPKARGRVRVRQGDAVDPAGEEEMGADGVEDRGVEVIVVSLYSPSYN